LSIEKNPAAPVSFVGCFKFVMPQAPGGTCGFFVTVQDK
jgi:hypothetical protein